MAEPDELASIQKHSPVLTGFLQLAFIARFACVFTLRAGRIADATLLRF
jgi:hypothetical protein